MPVIVGIVGVSGEVSWIVLVVGGGRGEVNNGGVVFVLVVVVFIGRRPHFAVELGTWLV